MRREAVGWPPGFLGFESTPGPGTLFTMNRYSKQRIFSVSPVAIREAYATFGSPVEGATLDDR